MRIIAGKFKGRMLKTPKGSSTRPTQGMLREALFNICQNEIKGARFLDLFAGSGAIGLEAISRGASHVSFIEQDRRAIQCIQENITALNIESATRIIPTNASRGLNLLAKEGAKFDLIFIDPPYDMQVDLNRVAQLLALNGTLFLEKRYKPIKSMPVPGLKMKEERRFGDTTLTLFCLEY